MPISTGMKWTALWGSLWGWTWFACTASASEWTLEESDTQTKVFSRDVSHSTVNEIKGITTVDAGLQKLVAFLQDPEVHSRWVPHGRAADIIDQPTPDRSIVHFVMNASWPFRARDAVASFTLSQSKELIVHIAIESQPTRVPPENKVIRIVKYAGFWLLTPVDPDHTAIEYQNHVEPGGQIPAWLANAVAVSTTFEALNNLRAELPRYNKPVPTRLGFIMEPAK